MVRHAFVGVLIAGLILGVVVLQGRDAMGFGSSTRSHNGQTTISLLPGLPGITLQGDPLYAKDDPWRRYLAPEHMCPGGEKLDAPLPDQANTMVCLVNYARAQDGLLPVEPVDVLNLTSLAKASKIIRCTDFNHDACGEDAAADARRAGYNGAWGENLYVAGGPARIAARRPRRLAQLASPPREPADANVANPGDRG